MGFFNAYNNQTVHTPCRVPEALTYMYTLRSSDYDRFYINFWDLIRTFKRYKVLLFHILTNDFVLRTQ